MRWLRFLEQHVVTSNLIDAVRWGSFACLRPARVHAVEIIDIGDGHRWIVSNVRPGDTVQARRRAPLMTPRIVDDFVALDTNKEMLDFCRKFGFLFAPHVARLADGTSRLGEPLDDWLRTIQHLRALRRLWHEMHQGRRSRLADMVRWERGNTVTPSATWVQVTVTDPLPVGAQPARRIEFGGRRLEDGQIETTAPPDLVIDHQFEGSEVHQWTYDVDLVSPARAFLTRTIEKALEGRVHPRVLIGGHGGVTFEVRTLRDALYVAFLLNLAEVPQKAGDIECALADCHQVFKRKGNQKYCCAEHQKRDENRRKAEWARRNRRCRHRLARADTPISTPKTVESER